MTNFLNKNFKKSGYKVLTFEDRSICKDIQKCINKYFYKPTKYYEDLTLVKFRKLVLKCQNSIIRMNIHQRFASSEKKKIEKILHGDVPLYETQLFLRAVRPITKKCSGEALNWHRETFYSNHGFIKHGINIWFPVKNVNKNNSLKYIEKSHLIPDNKVIRRKIKMTKIQKKNNPTKKFSVGHKLGFVYHPKYIVSGVNLKNQKTMNIPENKYALFSTMLIHGNSQNYSNKIRFAIGFGLIPKSKMKRNKILNPNRISSKKKERVAYKEYSIN